MGRRVQEVMGLRDNLLGGEFGEDKEEGLGGGTESPTWVSSWWRRAWDAG